MKAIQSVVTALPTLHIAKSVQTIAPVSAPATVVVQIGKGKYQGFSPFIASLYDVMVKGEAAIDKIITTKRQVYREMVAREYGTVCPTFEQHRANIRQLSMLATYDHLTAKVLVGPYNNAVKEAYGSLPVSTNAASIKKAELRKASQAALSKVELPIGAAKGAPQNKPVSAQESLEQSITRFGLANVLLACSKILASAKATSLDAKTLAAVADHLKEAA